jgi:hypothetical protein
MASARGRCASFDGFRRTVPGLPRATDLDPVARRSRAQVAYSRASAQDQGTLTGNRVTGRWSVVSGSGTGELAGLRGDGGFTAELGHGADITLDYWFE